MQPGGPRQTILVATALAASAVLAAWWWSAQQRDAATTSPKVARAEGAGRGVSPAAREPVARTATTSTPMAPTPAATKPAAPDIRDADGTPPSSNTGDTARSNLKPELATADEAASDTLNPDAEESEADENKADDASGAEAVDAPAPGSAVDADRVADMYADLFETVESGDVAADASRKLEFQNFDAREAGGESERDLERALRERFGDWVATLPPELAQHALLASVDCHVGQCRVLLAQNGVDFTEPAVRDPHNALNVMQSAIWTFLGEGLPDQRHWHVISNSWSAASSSGEGPLDTALWIILLDDEDQESPPATP